MAKGEDEEGIRVYLRIRPPPTSQQSRLLAAPGAAGPSPAIHGATYKTNAGPRTCQYEVDEDFQKSVLHLHTTQRLLQEAQRSAGVAGAASEASDHASAADDVVNNTVVDFSYQFDRVFRPTATQEDVFNTVAKDCVASVLDGLNSTVFAYGQTGSGKTYSITGGTESYQDRGLIPRAMAMIYEEVARRRESVEDASTTFQLTMSYLQIYNDKGQDLLNHGHDARTLEELPPVTIHEMEDDIVLKGLEQHSAPTLSDALNLLFLGDTNRLYCETPMNKTSSRSHCIFTVYIEARSTTSSTVRRSKLNLVDLAGSERVSKTGVSGTILTEAKHINLSLHFLEQVIVALSERAKGLRDHIPYRNSFLTMVLRDSLGRNCKTAMLATAHVVASQVAETISTCQFAQRVAMIRQAPQVNVETDPVLLVKKLKAEVAQLKDEVAYLRANGGGGGGAGDGAADRVLSDDEKSVCRGLVDVFVQRAAVEGDWATRLTGLNGDMARIYFCYDVLRERLVKNGGGGAQARTSGSNGSAKAAEEKEKEQLQQLRTLADESETQVRALRQSLQLKENELQMLLTVLKRAGVNSSGGGSGIGGPRYSAPTQTLSSTAASTAGAGAASADEADVRAFQFFGTTSNPQSDAELRQRIYQEARQLIHQLRQSSGTTRKVSAAPPQQPQPSVMSQGASQAAAQAALTRVTTLAQQGQLTEAEAAAATEFLESKKGLGQQQAQRLEESEETMNDGRSAVDVLMDEQLVQDRAQALEAFKASYEAQHKVEETKQLLRPKYDSCKATAQQLNACVDTIKQLKTKIQRCRAERAADGSDEVDGEETAWLEELRATKERYNTHAAQLRQDKEEIDGMHAYLKHAQEQLVRDFERWFSARQQQVQLAVQQQHRHAQQGRSEEQQEGLAKELRAALGTAAVAAAERSAGQEAHTTDAHAEADKGTHAASAEFASTTSASDSSPAFHRVLPAPAAQPSAAFSPPLLSRPYPSSAPANTSALAPVSAVSSPAAPSNHGGVSSGGGGLAPYSVNSARAQPRLASLPNPTPATAATAATPGVVSARTLDQARQDGGHIPSSFSASCPSHPLSGAVSAGKAGGWMAAAAAVPGGGAENTIGNSSSGGGPSPIPTRPFHLQPLDGSGGGDVTGVSGASAAQSSSGSNNPYFPQFPSTGNAAADEQLAQLYRAREAMRKRLQ